VITALYNSVIPRSLNCEAIVPYTGTSSSPASNMPRLRLYCFFTSRSASNAPRLSNLLRAIISAKSSISIFSNCVAAPYSGVITYKDTSECSSISVSDWPIPDVSKIIRSKSVAFNISNVSLTYTDNAKFD